MIDLDDRQQDGEDDEEHEPAHREYQQGLEQREIDGEPALERLGFQARRTLEACAFELELR